MKNIKAKIISNEKVADGRFKIAIDAPAISKEARPGQFVMVKCSEGLIPLLRRPLSFHRIEKKSFELLYQVIGKGTELLSQKRKGEKLDIIGPLGNGFDIHPAESVKHETLLVAGGIGIAPLLALAQKLKDSNIHFTTLIGAKTRSHVLCADKLEKLGSTIKIATEDGSLGHKGFITDILKNMLAAKSAKLTNLYACGPRNMLKKIAEITKSKKTMCQVSLEERMACGSGVCLGCAVKTATGIKMACKDGPVFNAGDIIW